MKAQINQQYNMIIALIFCFLFCLAYLYYIYDSFEEQINELDSREKKFNLQIYLTTSYLNEVIKILDDLKYPKYQNRGFFNSYFYYHCNIILNYWCFCINSFNTKKLEQLNFIDIIKV